MSGIATCRAIIERTNIKAYMDKTTARLGSDVSESILSAAWSLEREADIGNVLALVRIQHK